uniref:Cytochrome P450 n=1 Tax=Streptomyces sp. ML694-90F3 TaxID=1265536 RepID=A0A077KT40_9ACTN|nr:cytochrome P450 [Streptomyces sp. ML694-90F3]
MTRHQVDPRTLPDADLARHLLTVRGVHWMNGDRGAPLALLLRDHAVDRAAVHAGLRDGSPLRQTDLDVWVTAGHATASAVLADPRLTVRDPRTARRRRRPFTLGAGATAKHVLAVDDTVFGLEKGDVERLGALAGPLLDGGEPQSVARGFRELAAVPDGPFDLITDFARPGTAAALAALFALPGEVRDRYAALVGDTAPVLDALLCPPTLAATRALTAAYDQIAEDVDRLVKDGGTPFGDGAPAADVRALCLLVLVGGAQLAVRLIHGTVTALLAEDGAWAAVRDDPALVPAAVDETLRHDPPLRIVSRIAADDTEIAGLPVAAGDQVAVLLDAAGRDPAAFTEPNRFLPGRADRAQPPLLADPAARLLTPLLRLLAFEAVTALAARAPRLAPAGPAIRWLRTPVTGAVARCPVTTGQPPGAA